MNITIVGSGNVGRALGGGWRKAGHSVTFAARDPAGAKATELAREGFGVVPQAGAGKADVIVLAVPWSGIEATMKVLGNLSGKVVIDCTDPLNATRELALGFNDSGGETVARLSPGARVVKAFSTTGAANMADSRYPGGKLMMAIAGDDADAKSTVMALASDLGFEPVDTGPLAMSRYLEPLAMLWINLAYVQGMGREFGFALLRR
ncbi:MAG: 8-hydroxy-5-deazaflavin:NADPH oxidoreductase [Hyphomicrobiales bacterium]|jgi:predicted dinucleotide-binding enzyme|nr:8-hydroxy-5-deazaflavin:NADPH oxidoreductase [Hyphomicrobiales bacterium]